MQSGTVGKSQNTSGAAGCQFEARAKVEQLERNQNQILALQHPPDETFSNVQSSLCTFTIDPAAKKDVEVQEPHPLNAMLRTDGQQNVYYQQDGRSEGVFSNQRHTNMLTEPSGFKAGIKIQRNQLDSSLNIYPKVELPCDRPKLLCPPSFQQIQSNPSHQISFRSPREYMFNFQPNVSFREIHKQVEFMRQYQGPLNSPSGLKPALAGLGTCVSPQQQTESRLIRSGGRANMHFYPVASQQINLSQRMHWSPQKAAGARVITRSFSGTHEMGQAGWRILQNSRNTSLGRSLSMTERCAGAGLHPI